MLYFRMLLTMAVSLYTSRVVLNTLGVEDFGIYDVVGGFVAMLGFLNNSMASATQRFLSFEIGKGENSQFKEVFLMSLNIHFFIAIIIVIIAETFGLWLVDTQLTIPTERVSAAKWVYQFSVLTFVVNVISVPYNATIIAHERMGVFAVVSIIEVVLKLLIVFMLGLFGFDKLKFYAVLMFLIAPIIRIIYGIYCKINFKDTKYEFYWNKSKFKEIMSYAGWTFWGNGSTVLAAQGINILLNIFYGPTVNAARGIAYQVRNAVFGFFINFQMAVNPQIIKSYASKNTDYMYKLIFQSTKLSYYLLYIISLPLLLETKYILTLWLTNVPEHTVMFVRLILITILVESISGGLIAGAQASGRVKYYHIIVGTSNFLVVPISYFILKTNVEPYMVFIIGIGIVIISLILRIIIVRRLIGLSIREFVVKSMLRILFVSLLSFGIPYYIYSIDTIGWERLILTVVVSVVSSLFFVWVVGLSKSDKNYLKEIVLKKIKGNK